MESDQWTDNSGFPFTAYISLAVWTVMHLQVDQWNDSTRLFVIRGLEVIETVFGEDEPASAPALVFPS